MPLLVTPDKKRKTESICESSGIKLRSSQELHVNQTLSVCVSAHDPASVHAFVCARYIHNCTHTHTHTHTPRPRALVRLWGRERPNTVVFICNLWDGVRPATHQSHSEAAKQ